MSNKTSKLKVGVTKVAATVFGTIAGVLGAAAVGGVTAAAQSLQSGNLNWQTIGSAAAIGGVAAAVGYFVPSPLKDASLQVPPKQ